jgi:hypothetical protein
LTLNRIYIPAILILCTFGDLFAQTSQWRLIWDKNAVEDSVEYYVVYRRANSLPSSADSVGWRPQPSAAAEDSVVYADFNLSIGTRYYYRVVAVDSLARRSGFSSSVDAAIPEITFGTLVLTVDTTQALDTVIIDLDNADYVNDPDDEFNVSWFVTSGSQISVQIDEQNRATFISTTNLTHQESIQFSVVDPDSFYDERSVLISLAGTGMNQIPLINTSPPLTVQVGESYQYTVAASDPNGDNLMFTMTEGPSFLNLTQINNTSALISGTPSSAGGPHRITIVVNDGHGGVNDQTYFLNVTPEPGNINLIAALSSETFGSSIVRLIWTTTEPTKDFVNYGLDQSYGLFTIEESNFSTEHEAVIKGLLPDTTYHYQIVSETVSGSEVLGPDDQFQTEAGIKLEVFPIPYVASQAQANDGITFVNVPESSTIVIYNLMAEPVFKVDDITHVFNWDIKSNAGRNVSAGLYIYYIRDKNDIRLASGKLIIVR